MNNQPKQNETAHIVERQRTNAQASGEQAERLAEAYLARQGYRTLTRNYRCKAGEIDLICLHASSLVFVEVRLRSNASFGSAADSVTAQKRERIIRAANWWLCGPGHRHASRPCRFDVITLNKLSDDAIEWIPGAFDAG